MTITHPESLLLLFTRLRSLRARTRDGATARGSAGAEGTLARPRRRAGRGGAPRAARAGLLAYRRQRDGAGRVRLAVPTGLCHGAWRGRSLGSGRRRLRVLVRGREARGAARGEGEGRDKPPMFSRASSVDGKAACASRRCAPLPRHGGRMHGGGRPV